MKFPTQHPTQCCLIYLIEFSVRMTKDVLSLGLEYAVNPQNVFSTDYFLPFEKFLNKLKTLDARLLPGEKGSVIFK